jgi:hypothetical protein
LAEQREQALNAEKANACRTKNPCKPGLYHATMDANLVEDY